MVCVCPPPPWQYPEWLRQHGAALPAEQYERYRAQLGVMGRICQALEGERPGEGEEQRRARFDTLLELMQQVGGGPGAPRASLREPRRQPDGPLVPP